MKKCASILVLILLLLGMVPVSAQGPVLSAQSAKAGAQDGVYVIGMLDDPVVTYEGGIPGLAATAPKKGEKINPNSGKVQKYVEHLDASHNAALNAVGAGAGKIYDYHYSLNGFSAVLTAEQAGRIASMPNVVSVEPDLLHKATTDNTPEFLGLTDDGGLWDQLDGVENAGEGIIVGIIDTGIWPEHPSFSDQVDFVDRPGNSGKRTLAYGPPPEDWYGTCQCGEQWSQDDCNNKIIGARFYLDGFTHHGVITGEYESPRDKDGHGSHTASTAAGNYGIPASIFDIDRGTVSGMAPRARIAVYKAIWNGQDGGGYTSDLVAAIDQAVADGVDVINYSIGGSSSSIMTADARSFLYAANAGVFVATSAGNSGPGSSTLGNPAVAPWLTTVGASTQDRTFQGSVTLGNAATYYGASVTVGTDEVPLVDAEDAGSELCAPGALNPEIVEGKCVLCKRGDYDRVEKSLAVQMAGGVGMILYNVDDSQETNTDNHYVPSLHVNNTDGLLIKAYIDSAAESATAQITGGVFTTIDAPWMASFSSRGPNAGAPDAIKPDVTAPGVNILGANSPTAFLGAEGQLFQSIGGTSMSSPHVAGIGALLKQAQPDWSPAMIKSALMTTAYDVKMQDGVTDAGPFDMGAGHVAPNSAVDPGLVYDAGWNDYLAFICGAAPANISSGTCSALVGLGYSTDPSDLNLASIGIGQLAGVQTVARTVTNVGQDATYNVTVDAPPGIDVAVDPATLELDEGESATYEVTFTHVSAELNEWAFGSLTWSDGTHDVRSPLAVRPVLFGAPDKLSGTGTSGSLSYSVGFGYTGDFAALAHGLIPATTEAGYVVDDPANDINTALGSGLGVTYHEVDIPEGTTYARISLFDAYTDGDDDLDLYVFGPGPGYPQVGGSGSGTSAEEVNLVAPAPGDYIVVVHGWGTDGPDANYTLFHWELGEADAGNMSLTAPAAATPGSASIDVDWSGLDAGQKYLGSISHHDVASPTNYDDGRLKTTIVRIDTD